MIIPLEDFSSKLLFKLANDVFIYPTDTIYGLGCDAENKSLVKKIREIKKRDNNPFSVIAPSLLWILENCEANKLELEKYLPGPYTFILKKKKKDFLNHVSHGDFLGVRIPDHNFTRILQKLGRPIITTSVNLQGKMPANEVSDINQDILNQVEVIIDAGRLSGKPSTLIKDGNMFYR